MTFGELAKLARSTDANDVRRALDHLDGWPDNDLSAQYPHIVANALRTLLADPPRSPAQLAWARFALDYFARGWRAWVPKEILAQVADQ